MISTLFSQWRDYLELCKPRVVALMLLTVVVGMYSTHAAISWSLYFWATLGIACCAGSAAAVNHLVDRHIDGKMKRTARRPLVRGILSEQEVLIFACMLGSIGFGILYSYVNLLTAVLTLFALIGYAGIYTGYLKHATPQNIVIGGLAGAFPPLLGWVAVTNHLDPQPWLLVLIIYTWTPPHFWALSLYRIEDYQKAEVPMLPVTHGTSFTKLYILLYTILLSVVSFLPIVFGMSGVWYGAVVSLLNARFLYLVIALYYAKDDRAIAYKTFRYSIVYLMCLFAILLIDH